MHLEVSLEKERVCKFPFPFPLTLTLPCPSPMDPLVDSARRASGTMSQHQQPPSPPPTFGWLVRTPEYPSPLMRKMATLMCPLFMQPQMDYTLTPKNKSGSLPRIFNATPSKPPRTPFASVKQSTRKQPISLFLTKTSHVQSFNKPIDNQWDHDLREQRMDDFFEGLMTRMKQQGQSSADLKETVGFYRTKSESTPRPHLARNGISSYTVSS